MNFNHRLRNWSGFLKDYLFLIALLTIFLTDFSNKEVNNWLSQIANVDNHTIYTYNYTLGIYGLILAIPSAMISILLVKGALKLEARYLPTPILIRFNAFVVWCFKILFKIGKLLIKVGGWAVLAFFWFINAITDKFEVGKGGSSYSGHSVSRHSNPSYERDQLKKQANWEAEQKKKEAQYAWKHAGKQGKYNKNTHHFDDRVNRAKAMTHEANKAKKRARNL